MPINRSRIGGIVNPTMRAISTRLGVAARPVSLRIAGGAFYARTKINWPPDPAVITLSEESLNDRPVLAHELTHCLVPTRSLFLAEGFATLIGAEFRGDCSDFFFDCTDVDDAVRAYRPQLPPLREMAAETPDSRFYFDVARSHMLDVRLAYVAAASFVRWWMTQTPDLASRVADKDCAPAPVLMDTVFKQPVGKIEDRWLSSLARPAGAGMPC
ncbi:hypothetical protein [Eilatimonas milleporae]|uniref:Peptidase MA superfamily protein n=1 Tax=Eilatimonas milleporae TaxID=911205 RepID=A0A3M0CQW8_9PROT|nr:hypothetical protein [Eilatimonas milleporae]RMB11964.1 hypothetical protein BXY39_0452 [Eilatimonas milleporae]